jgi:hypothetical protein
VTPAIVPNMTSKVITASGHPFSRLSGIQACAQSEGGRLGATYAEISAAC